MIEKNLFFEHISPHSYEMGRNTRYSISCINGMFSITKASNGEHVFRHELEYDILGMLVEGGYLLLGNISLGQPTAEYTIALRSNIQFDCIKTTLTISSEEGKKIPVRLKHNAVQMNVQNGMLNIKVQARERLSEAGRKARP